MVVTLSVDGTGLWGDTDARLQSHSLQTGVTLAESVVTGYRECGTRSEREKSDELDAQSVAAETTSEWERDPKQQRKSTLSA